MVDHTRLPVQFRTVTKITNHQCRLRIISYISDILQYLENLKHYQMSPQMGTMVSRFFLYLTDSCNTPEKVNKRSLWLQTYSEIVHHRLAMHNIALGLVTINVSDPIKNSSFYDTLLDILHRLQQYCVLHDIQQCFIPTETMAELLAHGQGVVPDETRVAYSQLVELVATILERLILGIRLRARLSNDSEIALFYEIKKLAYLTSKYNIPPL